MSLPARSLVLTYGTTSVGAGTNYLIDAFRTPIVYEKTPDRFTFACEVIVSETTKAAFETAVAALELAFDSTNKNKKLVVTFGGVDQESYDPATNTGFNAVPSFRKSGSDADSGLSRRYMISVSLDLPYNEAGKAGRKNTRWALSFTDARRRALKILGTYTALATNQAYKQYRTALATYAGLLQTALGGSWEGPLGEDVQGDGEYNPSGTGDYNVGKLVTFTSEYQELIYGNSNAGVDARLKRTQLLVSAGYSFPGDYAPGGAAVERLRQFKCDYSCSVDWTSSQDLVGLYNSVVRPFMLAEVAKVAGTSAIAVTFREPVLNRTQNTIVASLSALTVGTSSFVSSRITTTDEVDAGNETVGKWSGKKFDKQVYENTGTFLRTVEHVYEVVGEPGTAANAVDTVSMAGGQIVGLNVNQAVGFQITENGAGEQALDSFFFGGGSAPSSLEVGGVPAPAELQPVFRHGYVVIEPLIYGEPGDAQIHTTRVTKRKVYELVVDASGAASE